MNALVGGSCRRTLSVGFSKVSTTQSRGIHKNKYLEEWTGLRENKYKSFKFDKTNIPSIVFWVGIFPGGLFLLILNAENDNGNRTYKFPVVKEE